MFDKVRNTPLTLVRKARTKKSELYRTGMASSEVSRLCSKHSEPKKKKNHLSCKCLHKYFIIIIIIIIIVVVIIIIIIIIIVIIITEIYLGISET